MGASRGVESWVVRALLLGVMLVLGGYFTPTAASHLLLYQNDKLLWGHCTRVDPLNNICHRYLANYYASYGEYCSPYLCSVIE